MNNDKRNNVNSKNAKTSGKVPQGTRNPAPST